MKKQTVFFYALLYMLAPTVFAQQTISGKIEDFPPKTPPMTIILFMFGVDYPVKIGESDNMGNISISFPTELPDSISAETRSMFAAQFQDAFFLPCYDMKNLSDTIKNAVVFKGGYVCLSHKTNPWVGTLFPVSDSRLIPWIEDRYQQNAAIASFFEIIYCTSNITLNTTCKDSILYAEGNMIDVEYRYALQLKKGFNLIEYKIEALKHIGLPEATTIPSLITIENANGSSVIKWYAKYFYSQFK